MITYRKVLTLNSRVGCKPILRAIPVPLRPIYLSDISGRQRLAPACCSAGGDSGGGTGVSEKPSTSKTLEKSTKSVKKKPPTYKVMLHNDSLNKREKVVKVLMKVVDGMTMEGALAVMGEAHEHGIAVVIVCPQDEAERYCEQLRLCGLTSSIEA